MPDGDAGPEDTAETAAAPFPYSLMLRTAAEEFDMSRLKGKVLLIVNTAGGCEFSGQYGSMEKLYRRYLTRGFTVLAFPSDDFGKEPDDDAAIAASVVEKYGVTFPVFSKTSVKGGKKHPLFQWLTDRSTNPDFGGKIAWNFNKFLVSRSGEVIARFGSRDDPEDGMIVEMVEEALQDAVME